MLQEEDKNEVIFVDNNSKTLVSIKDLEGDSPLHLNKAYWIPALGTRKFDGHIYISGATGAGKSYLISKIIENDKMKRECILFTDLKTSDPAFKGMKYVTFDEKGQHNTEWLSKNQSKKIMIFDDIQYNEDVLKYRDYMLEKARHVSTIVICVNHKLQDYFKSKVPLNECRFVVTFPCSNRGSVLDYLKDAMGIKTKLGQEIIELACKEGRHLIIHRFHPNVLACTETIIKI